MIIFIIFSFQFSHQRTRTHLSLVPDVYIAQQGLRYDHGVSDDDALALGHVVHVDGKAAALGVHQTKCAAEGGSEGMRRSIVSQSFI